MQSISRRSRVARLLATALLVIPPVGYALAQEGGHDPNRIAGWQADGSTAASANQTPAAVKTTAHPDAPGKPDIRALQQAWIDACDRIMKDKVTKADSVDENFLNHAIWYSATNWKRPYPGETEIKWPDAFVKAAAEKAHGDDDDDDQDGKLKKAAAAAERDHGKH